MFFEWKRHELASLGASLYQAIWPTSPTRGASNCVWNCRSLPLSLRVLLPPYKFTSQHWRHTRWIANNSLQFISITAPMPYRIALKSSYCITLPIPKVLSRPLPKFTFQTHITVHPQQQQAAMQPAQHPNAASSVWCSFTITTWVGGCPGPLYGCCCWWCPPNPRSCSLAYCGAPWPW